MERRCPYLKSCDRKYIIPFSLLLFGIFVVFFCVLFYFNNFVYSTVVLSTANVRVFADVADTSYKRAKGLSGVEQIGFDEGMLFVFPSRTLCEFWMPETYFDMDIFFLDESMRVLDVHRSVPHCEQRVEPVPRTKKVYCSRALEMESTEYSKFIRVGDIFSWN